MDWSEVYPFWLVAEDEKIVGALQIILAKPIGWLEMLVLDTDYPQMLNFFTVFSFESFLLWTRKKLKRA